MPLLLTLPGLLAPAVNFTRPQQEIINLRLGTTRNLIVQSPTGSGKSFLSKMWIESALRPSHHGGSILRTPDAGSFHPNSANLC